MENSEKLNEKDSLKVIYEMLEEEKKKDFQLINVKPRPATREEIETTLRAADFARTLPAAGTDQNPHLAYRGCGRIADR